MATYISLVRWTEQGIKSLKESPSRLDAVREAFKQAGGHLRDFYLVTGQYDIICIFEAPDDETIARMMLSIGSKGSVRSETIRAFNEDEYRRIIGSL